MQCGYDGIMLLAVLLEPYIRLVQSGEVAVLFEGRKLRNNSAFTLTYVLYEQDLPLADGLVCLTDRDPCCTTDSGGSWYSPDGYKISTDDEEDFYQIYPSNRQAIVLHRMVTAYSNGLFTCEILDSNGTTWRFYIGSGESRFCCVTLYSSKEH